VQAALLSVHELAELPALYRAYMVVRESKHLQGAVLAAAHSSMSAYG
jgi:hypothetical protein